MNSQINWEAYTDFFYFVNERHSIYLKKEADEPKPWTDDPIFQQWKFCNVFRTLDKQTKWLINNVITPHYNDSYNQYDRSLLLFNIFLFRAFNLSDTYEAIMSNIFNFYTEEWKPQSVNDILCQLDKITSGAYMMRGREGMPKYESIVLTLNDIWNKKKEIIAHIESRPTLQNAWEYMMNQNFWGWGPFTLYQIVLDLTYSPILTEPTDIKSRPTINDWCVFGPGAEKGLREIWPDLPLKEEWMLTAAKSLLVDQVKYRQDHVPVMTLQDVEFCLCELGKYRRIKAGGRGKEKYSGRA